MTAHAATTRDLERRLLGGVCAGIADRYDRDLKGVRAVTVALSVLTAGLGGLAYVALWLLLPAGARRAPVAPAAAVGAVTPVAAPPSSVAAGDRYGPVAADLARVDEALASLADVKFPWLRETLRASVGGSGKRLRPAITLLAGRMGRYDLDRLVPLAASVELLHTATLVHDDVIDDAPERRGNPTPAALFGNAASVMLGDYMFAQAAGLVAQTGDIRVIRNFAATVGQMASGELQQDLSAFEYSEDVQRYLDRIAGKTASLFATAAEGGALVTGAPEPQVEPLRRYGEALGMAFQIVDDILDFTGDPREMGKPVGSDLLAGTLTLPALLYMQRDPEHNTVKRAFEGTPDEATLRRAVEEIRASDVLDEAYRTASYFGDLAREALRALPPSEARETLDRLVDYVLERRN